MPVEYDVVVVGGGPGGYPAALRARELGLRVALVEGAKVGGVCLHAGCIPTKALLHVAKVQRTILRSPGLGFDAALRGLDFGRAGAHRDEVVNTLFRGVQGLLKRAGVDVVDGWATVHSRHEVDVDRSSGDTVTLRTANVIVATGSSPRPLPGIAFDGVHILSSDDAVAANELPATIIIVGSGAIGVEFASLYSDLGVRVTLVEMESEILPQEDPEVAAVVRKELERRGVAIMTNSRIAESSVSVVDDDVHCSVRSNDETTDLSATRLLVAIGRIANVASAGIEKLGVRVERGFVVTDARQQTHVPGIYAIGDLTGGFLLAHKATAEGIVAAEAIAGLAPAPINPNLVPRCTYSYPEVASFGLTDVQALAAGYRVRTGKLPLSVNPRAIVDDEPAGFVKVVAAAETGEILGVHAVGTNVTELIAGPIVAAGMEATVLELGRAIYPHPTVSEVIAEAALRALANEPLAP